MESETPPLGDKYLKEAIRAVRTKGVFPWSWSVGRTWKIGPGDRLFMLKQGEVPRGIMGAGVAISYVYEAPHWDKRRPGKMAQLVEFDWDALNPPTEDLLLLVDDVERELRQRRSSNSQRGGQEVGRNWCDERRQRRDFRLQL